jgi:hypothetical protein
VSPERERAAARVVAAAETIGYADGMLTAGEEKFDCAGLRFAAIVTTDWGPWADDMALWLALPGADLVVPSAHAGFMAIINSLNADFPIDYEQVIAASCCAQNARFTLWQR